ncbi:hypothetical protein VTL71DRAFT_7410 [Oculimacula yallundae]|uniref:Secreted protein n=1 Tax=Oculimacula yallundae TaxID=86028 RepID=A0ABR4BU10_9HELO
MIFVILWSIWPPETPVDASTMNYSVLTLICEYKYIGKVFTKRGGNSSNFTRYKYISRCSVKERSKPKCQQVDHQ